MNRTITFEAVGMLALFTDPLTKIGGEKMSYPVPTYSALEGLCESIYWKPTFYWVIDKVRVMNKIATFSMAVNHIFYHKPGHDRAMMTYLQNPRYQIEAHMEWDLSRPDLKNDRNVRKHMEMAKRALKVGGRRQTYFGTSECSCDVEPCEFGNDTGYYDDIEEIPFGCMVHSIQYPRNGNDSAILLWTPVMKHGVIEFIPQKDCKLKKSIDLAPSKKFILSQNVEPIDKVDIRREFGL